MRWIFAVHREICKRLAQADRSGGLEQWLGGLARQRQGAQGTLIVLGRVSPGFACIRLSPCLRLRRWLSAYACKGRSPAAYLPSGKFREWSKLGLVLGCQSCFSRLPASRVNSGLVPAEPR